MRKKDFAAGVSKLVATIISFFPGASNCQHGDISGTAIHPLCPPLAYLYTSRQIRA
jgi:hypothetical protein